MIQQTLCLIKPDATKRHLIGKILSHLEEAGLTIKALKKIQYFLNKVRLDLMIDTQYLDDSFVKRLHLKTGKNIELIQEAVDLINKIQNQHIQVNHSDLAKINEVLDKILKS